MFSLKLRNVQNATQRGFRRSEHALSSSCFMRKKATNSGTYVLRAGHPKRNCEQDLPNSGTYVLRAGPPYVLRAGPLDAKRKLCPTSYSAKHAPSTLSSRRTSCPPATDLLRTSSGHASCPAPPWRGVRSLFENIFPHHDFSAITDLFPHPHSTGQFRPTATTAHNYCQFRPLPCDPPSQSEGAEMPRGCVSKIICDITFLPVGHHVDVETTVTKPRSRTCFFHGKNHHDRGIRVP